MRVRITRIGNSRGIRIPKVWVEQLGAGQEELEMEMRPEGLVIRPVRKPRAGWEEQFQEMARRGDDQQAIPDIFSLSQWDDQEWEW